MSSWSSGDAIKQQNREQFGPNAANYATSEAHAKGASLKRMVEVAAPEPHWTALDIATAAGHTAFAFAPHVASVIATDLTPEMVELAASRAADANHHNVTVRLADAEDLPFDDASFDLVTCRVAPHHFPSPKKFVDEMARVLCPDGVAVMVDNVVPDPTSPDQAAIGEFCNAWEARRDPGHVRCLSVAEWTGLFESSRLHVEVAEVVDKRMDFNAWADNMSVAEELRRELLADLFDSGDDVRAYLRPEGQSPDDAVFYLTEGLFLARKAQD